MHQLHSGKLPKSFNVLNYFNRPERPTRQIYTNMAKQCRARTTFSSLLPFHMFTKIGNDFQTEIREFEKASIFKHKLRTQMLDNYQREIICTNKYVDNVFLLISKIYI